jgi:hypothetical protein
MEGGFFMTVTNVKFGFAWMVHNLSYNIPDSQISTAVIECSEELDAPLTEEQVLTVTNKLIEYKNSRPKDDEDYESRFEMPLLKAS